MVGATPTNPTGATFGACVCACVHKFERRLLEYQFYALYARATGDTTATVGVINRMGNKNVHIQRSARSASGNENSGGCNYYETTYQRSGFADTSPVKCV